MAKKTAVGNTQQFPGMEDTTPTAVVEAADEYVKCLRTKNKAQEKLNTAKENCIAVMRANGIDKIRIDDGAKWLKVDAHDTLKTEKIKEESEGD